MNEYPLIPYKPPTLKIDLLGDTSATDLILIKLLEVSSDDNREIDEIEYSNVKDLAGLKVVVRLSKHTREEDPPDALCIALSTELEIDKYLYKKPATTTVVIVLNHCSEETKKALTVKVDDFAGRNQFLTFAETNDRHLENTFDSLIDMAVVLSSDKSLMSLDKSKRALNQTYYSHWAKAKKKNILHLLARRNLGLMINRLADDIEQDDMFKLMEGLDENGNTPLVAAALNSKGVALAAMLNFYSSNINMSDIHNSDNKVEKDRIYTMLHVKDRMGHNLTYHIIQTSMKVLGPYGTILQMEKDFHVKPGKKDGKTDEEEVDEVDDFLELQICLQKNQGSTLETSLVMKLLSSTRETSTGAKWTRIFIFVFLLTVSQLFLHISDVVSDGLLAEKYFYEWMNDTQEVAQLQNMTLWMYSAQVEVAQPQNMTLWMYGAQEEVAQPQNTLLFYPSQLHASHKFMYYLFFILAPFLLYIVEILRELCGGNSCIKRDQKTEDEGNKEQITKELKELKEPKADQTSLQLIEKQLILILFPLSVFMWPVIISLRKAYHLYKFHSTKGHKQLQWKEYSNVMAQKAGMIHLSEVCIESTFTSILNWYIILPNFLLPIHLDSLDNRTDNSLILSAVSFMISIFSLAWSYTSYIAEQKYGALSLTWDPTSRIVLFISYLLLIFARMNCIVLFMFYFGPGSFYPGMLFLICHIILMMTIHAYNVIRYMTDQEQSIDICFIRRLFHVSLMNGLANVFTYNFVHISLKNQQSLGKKKNKSFYRQTIGDIIFFTENIFCVVFGCRTNVSPINNPVTMTYFVSMIFSCHIIGILLKVFYYKFLHIWKDLTPTFDFSKRSFKRADGQIQLFKKNKTTM